MIDNEKSENTEDPSVTAMAANLEIMAADLEIGTAGAARILSEINDEERLFDMVMHMFEAFYWKGATNALRINRSDAEQQVKSIGENFLSIIENQIKRGTSPDNES